MSTTEQPKQMPRRRLGKITDPNPRFASSKKGKGKALQATIRSPTPTQSTPAPQPRQPVCCDSPNHTFNEELQTVVCQNCFTQIADSNIVAEIEFNEDSRGATTMQGGFISENARHASTLGQAATQIAGATQKSQETTARMKCSNVLARIKARFGLNEQVEKQTYTLFELAVRMNFTPGRRTDEVVGACLYAMCRQQRENTIILMDIAEVLKMGVFRLGEVYKDLCKDLYINPNMEKNPENRHIKGLQVIHVESLVMKYCRKLEFGNLTNRVAEDAVKIISRMKRDWMVTGRHPAGLCGAAIIFAARMSNFRRSVREIVYVVKVTDMTIHKRMMEFRRSKSTALSVEQFRKFGLYLKDANDPPALLETHLQKAKFEAKQRKRQAESLARESAERQDGTYGASISNDVAEPTNSSPTQDENDNRRKRRRTTYEQSATPVQTQQEPRRDADGFVIPARPTDNTQQADEQQSNGKRGHKKKDQPSPVDISEAELITEELLKNEIEYKLVDSEMTELADEVSLAKSGENAAKIAAEYKKGDAEKSRLRREADNINWVKEPSSHGEVTAEELELEFADDPEVQRCLLSEEEQKAKEQIWIVNNEDWLRHQQEKKLLEAVAKAAGRNEKGKKPGKNAKKKRKGKMGDGTLLQNARENGDTPINTPEQATGAMLERWSPQMSKNINEAALKSLFHRPTPSSTSESGSAQNGDTTSDEPSPTNAGAEAPEDSPSSTRSTPVPTYEAARIPSPPTTQQAGGPAAPGDSPERRRADILQPATPPQTQAQTAGAVDEDSEGDEDDYVQEEDELDFGSDNEPPGDDDDDFNRALSPTNRLAVDDDAYGNDDYYSD